MSNKDKVIFTSFMSIAVIATVTFAMVWFNLKNVPNNFSSGWHVIDILLFLAITYVIWHQILLRLSYFFIASHIKINKRAPRSLDEGSKVAFITTYVPGSESTKLLESTLPAMVGANYTHDTWLLDEGDDSTAKMLCKKYGVMHFTRYGIDAYNKANGKFMSKTKGGNHNSWYNSVGDKYDFVAQIDTDFIPDKNFLTLTLRYFNDSKVGFVGTPQIYGNTDTSIIAHGAAQQTYSFYGPLLRGMSGIESSMLIGANHVVRVKALKEVDHYSAHITEDLLTGMKLHSVGWKSVYCPLPLAVGEGPDTWKAYFSQQKRWAYGCMSILYTYSPKLLKKMSLRQAVYYFCIQQHYFTGLTMILGVIGLVLYFYSGIIATNIDFTKFVFSYFGLIIIFLGISRWLQKFNTRPEIESGMMKYGMLVGIAVLPIYFVAFCSLFLKKKLKYKVTPKGKKISSKDMSIKLFAPHIFIGCIALSGPLTSLLTGRRAPLMIFWSLATGLGIIIIPIIPRLMNTINSIKNMNLNFKKLIPRYKT